MSAQFNGTDQGLSVAFPRSQFRNVSAATIACWANFNAFTVSNRVMTKFSTGTGNNTTRLSVGITTTQGIEIGCRILDGDSLADHIISLASPPGPGEWHHYAVAFDFSTRSFQLYYDGSRANTTTMTAVTAGSTSDTNSLTGGIGIANPPGGNSFWPGLLEDMRFYNRALGGDEVGSIYASRGRDDILTGITGRWPLNDLGVGTAIVLASDITGNGGVGAPVGTPVFSGCVTNVRTRPRQLGAW